MRGDLGQHNRLQPRERDRLSATIVSWVLAKGVSHICDRWTGLAAFLRIHRRPRGCYMLHPCLWPRSWWNRLSHQSGLGRDLSSSHCPLWSKTCMIMLVGLRLWTLNPTYWSVLKGFMLIANPLSAITSLIGLFPKVYGMDKWIVILLWVFWVLGGFFALFLGGFLDPRTCMGSYGSAFLDRVFMGHATVWAASNFLAFPLSWIILREQLLPCHHHHLWSPRRLCHFRHQEWGPRRVRVVSSTQTHSLGIPSYAGEWSDPRGINHVMTIPWRVQYQSNVIPP